MTAKNVGMVFGVVLVLVGLLGFISNPIVGDEAVFLADAVHNLVHLITGLIFVIVAMKSAESMSSVLKIFGIIYLLVAILGFLTTSEGVGTVLGLFSTNGADNLLHLLLGIVFLAAGLKGKKEGIPMATA